MQGASATGKKLIIAQPSGAIWGTVSCPRTQTTDLQITGRPALPLSHSWPANNKNYVHNSAPDHAVTLPYTPTLLFYSERYSSFKLG